jgi:REP element-mobilizing transposase RayT
MPRRAREKSSTGIYHVMLRGIDKRNIFLDDEDRMKFIEYIGKARENGGFKVYGYCLMDNHVHILIKEGEEIGESIKRITVGYVGWHNRKYERTGHLFQNRFLSEPVETDAYLLMVLRYIHQNPVKARMVNKAEDYQWSSYKQYYLSYQKQDSFIDGDLIKTYFKTFEDFSNYMNAYNNDECLEHNVIKRYNDNTLKEIIEKEYNIDKLPKLSIEERNEIIKEIYDKTNASIRQLSRIIGLGKTAVEKAIKEDR